MTTRWRPTRTRLSWACLIITSALAVLWPCRVALGWGPEGHAVIALVAERYMTQAALAKAGDLLDGASIEAVASWADEYRHDHRETGPWHFIDIPLANFAN